jgi:hypothetical protein
MPNMPQDSTDSCGSRLWLQINDTITPCAQSRMVTERSNIPCVVPAPLTFCTICTSHTNPYVSSAWVTEFSCVRYRWCSFFIQSWENLHLQIEENVNTLCGGRGNGSFGKHVFTWDVMNRRCRASASLDAEDSSCSLIAVSELPAWRYTFASKLEPINFPVRAFSKILLTSDLNCVPI